jgi:hypothetical protein
LPNQTVGRDAGPIADLTSETEPDALDGPIELLPESNFGIAPLACDRCPASPGKPVLEQRPFFICKLTQYSISQLPIVNVLEWCLFFCFKLMKLRVSAVVTGAPTVVATDGSVPAELVSQPVPRHGDQERGQLVHRFDLRPASLQTREETAKNDLADIEWVDQATNTPASQSGSNDATEHRSEQVNKLRAGDCISFPDALDPMWKGAMWNHKSTPEPRGRIWVKRVVS